MIIFRLKFCKIRLKYNFLIDKIISKFRIIQQNLRIILSLILVLHHTTEFKKQINIIFSPACSSFDQYENFEQRGNKFKTLVSEITKNAG